MPICFKDGKECNGNIEIEPKKVSIISSPLADALDSNISKEIRKYGFWQKSFWEKNNYIVEHIIVPYNSEETLCESLCRKILQAEVVVIDLTYRDPNVFSALFLARKNRKITWLIAHAAGDLLQDFQDGKNLTIYGDNAEGLKVFCQKLENFIENIPAPVKSTKDNQEKDTQKQKEDVKQEEDTVLEHPMEKVSLEIPKDLKSGLSDLEVFSENNPLNKIDDDREIYWSFLVDLFQQNDTIFKHDLFPLKIQWGTVKYESEEEGNINVLSFIMHQKLLAHYNKNQRYYRNLFENVLFALTGKDILVKIKPRPIFKF